MREEDVYKQIEAALQAFAGRGIARKASDVEAYLRYRQALALSDQTLFDELLRQGNHPGAAAELVEVLSGREQPHGEPKVLAAVGS